MDKFFGNLHRVLLAGLVLAILVAILLHVDQLGTHAFWAFVFRWIHVWFGILWIGLLYYFNFVQTPSMPKIPDEHKPAIGKVIAPAALFYFRWAAAGTVLFGLITAGMNGYIGEALSFQGGYATIGIGVWLALIMAANVWFVIWPNQKKVLGLVEADADAKKKAARWAGIASRTNTLLSIPMLYCMVAQQNVG
ncbi:MAG TPA: urate hydroxylase PuuD [Dongiaceae bacterium]|nr:urate hydroxylase PuuD [Dongiaceae bacterium]